MAKRELGCVPSTPDRRDYKLSFKAVTKLASKIDLRRGLAPIFDQGRIGSCTGFGSSRAYRRMLKKQKIRLFQPSQLFIYYNGREMLNTIESDSGASIRDVMKSIATVGVCDIKSWRYDVTRFREKPPKNAYANARTINHQVVQYQSLDTLYDIKAALSDGMSIVIGFSVYSNFFNIGSNGLMPEPNGSMEGGHCVTIDGYDDTMQRFICSNSWSANWGDKGFFYMPYSYMAHIFDKWIIEKI